MYYAMLYAPSGKGSVQQLDFWVLVSNSSITLLGIITAMYPYRDFWVGVSSVRRWAQAFAVVGLLLVPASFVVYLYWSVRWSVVAVFCGLAIQAVMALQLVEDAVESFRVL